MRNERVSAEDVVSGKALNDFPKGVVFVCNVQIMAEAKEVITKYRTNSIGLYKG